MGVMTCHRKNCTSIMCDRYSHTYGYICNECFDELEGLTIKISKFMKTSKFKENKPKHTFESLSKEFIH